MRWSWAAMSMVCLLGQPAWGLGWPDGTLEKRLHDGSPNVRREAARSLAKLPRATGIALAERVLTDPDVDVRLAAADALLGLSSAGSAPTSTPGGAPSALAAWFTDADPRIRERACRLAARDPNSGLVAQLVRAMGDADVAVRIAAARALGAAPPTPETPATDPVPALAGKIEDGVVEIRVAVVSALGQLGDPRGIAAVAGRVRDQEPTVRRAAAAALGRFRDARAAAALEPLLADPVQDVQMAALRALGEQGVQERSALLAPLLTGPREPQRRAALAALGASAASAEAGRTVLRAAEQVLGREPGADLAPWRDALTPHASQLAPELRRALSGPRPMADLAAVVWSRVSPPPATLGCELAELLARRRLDEVVALEALGLANAGECTLAPLLERLAHARDTVRAAARTALYNYLAARPGGDSRAALPLRDALLRGARLAGVAGESSVAHRELIELLGMTRAPAAAPALVHELTVGSAPARRAAARALGSLAGNEPLGDRVLVDALADQDADVRRAAALALGERGGTRSLALLEQRWQAAKKDGGLDTGLALFAYGNAVSRAPSRHGLRWLAARRDDALPEERDVLVSWLARARANQDHRGLAAVTWAIGSSWEEAAPSDKRAALRGLSGLAEAREAGEHALGDADASVRAEGAALLGTLADALSADQLRRLTTLAAGQDAAAVNAAAALARRGASARTLCPLMSNARAEVRAGALLGLARRGERCADGASERALLLGDSSALVRLAAARALRAGKDRARVDVEVLGRCSDDDRDARVASECATSAAPPAQGRTARDVLTVYFAEEPSGSRPFTPFVVEYADGFLRAGLADRQGALFDPAAPRGTVRLADHGVQPRK